MIWRVFNREGGVPVVLFREGAQYAYLCGGPIPADVIPTHAFRTWAIFVTEEGTEAEWLTAVLADRWDPEEYPRKEQNTQCPAGYAISASTLNIGTTRWTLAGSANGPTSACAGAGPTGTASVPTRTGGE